MFFKDWFTPLWATVSSRDKLIRFYTWKLLIMSGFIHIKDDSLSFIVSQADVGFTGDQQSIQMDPHRGIRVALDEGIIHQTLKQESRGVYQLYPKWIDSFPWLKQIIKALMTVSNLSLGLFEGDQRVNIYFNTYLASKEDRESVVKGENTFQIIDDSIHMTNTFSFTVLTSSDDKWNVITKGFTTSSIQFSISFFQRTLLLKIQSFQINKLQLYDTESKPVNDDYAKSLNDHFSQALNNHKDIRLDLEEVEILLQCFGVSDFKLSLINGFSIVEGQRLGRFEKCDSLDHFVDNHLKQIVTDFMLQQRYFIEDYVRKQKLKWKQDSKISQVIHQKIQIQQGMCASSQYSDL